ncbi:MAG: NAD(+) synthase [Ruminococcaceae bacterium]|nr:NAD(+) synthase [Oscillospiraceae bacterium]
MRNYEEETQKRVAFIRRILDESGAEGIVYGNSGGKDCTLVSILCKMACDRVTGVIMPCQSGVNYGQDTEDALKVAKQYDIETVTVDLSEVKKTMTEEISKVCQISHAASANIAPRLRMSTLYTIAQSKNALVAGTGNRSERYMGYFTKWGDGAFDFNPIADLTVTEVYEFLRYLNAPASIIEKAPSAGLFEGQTDEKEMGVTYAQIDAHLNGEEIDAAAEERINRYHRRSAHKLALPPIYEG